MFWWYLWWPVCKWGSRHWPSSWASAHMSSRDTCVHRGKWLRLQCSHSRWCIPLHRALRRMGRWVTEASCLESWELCLKHKKSMVNPLASWRPKVISALQPQGEEPCPSRNACSKSRVPSCDLLSYSLSPGSHAKAQSSRKTTSTVVCCPWRASQETAIPMQQGFGKLRVPPSMSQDHAGVWSFKSAAENSLHFSTAHAFI